MWKHCCAFVCAIAALVYNTSASVRTANDPSTLPLIQFQDLKYTGAFRLPANMVNGTSFSIGGTPVAYNPARNSLFVGSLGGKLAEVSIPTPVNSAVVESLPWASFLQGFYEPTEGQLGRVGSPDVQISSVMVYGNRLYGTAAKYYDANNDQAVSHYSRSVQLNQPSFAGWSQVWEPERSGFVSGFMALVPSEWRDALGGPAITGQCCTAIAWRTSWGPSAFAFDPVLVGAGTVPAVPLLYYTDGHPTLGSWSGTNPVYGATATVAGVALIAGTRTALYFGRNGLGTYCYGNGTSTQSLHNTMGPDGAKWCYDPASSDKGQHAYPYRYQIWAYDLKEFADVKAGRKQPWDVKPYGVWPFELPTPEPSIKLGGIGYDSATQTIYVSQMRADKDGYSNRPIVHVLKVGGVSGSPLPVPSGGAPAPPPPAPAPEPAPAPAPAPPPAAKLTAVTITASKASPQVPGTTIVLTATPNGGAAPQQYKWYIHDDVRWNPVTSWSTSSTYTWTPTTAKSPYNISVGVRSAGSTSDVSEASVNFKFAISGTAAPAPAPAPPAKVTSVGLSANRTAPQAPATTITFNAIPAGGTAPFQYKWRVFDGASWTSGAWTTSNSYNWTPSTANSNYRVEVWARSSGNSADQAEALVGMAFPIIAPTSAPPPPPPPTTTPPPSQTPSVTLVSMTTSKASPQPPGTAIVLSATPLGGVAPHQYRWYLHDGLRWYPVSQWTTSNTHTWTPTVTGTHNVSVGVRSAGKTTDVAEANANIKFTISVTAPPSTAPPSTTQPFVSAVTLSANKASPQTRGTAITWTAVGTGGVGPLQYKFYVSDGAGSTVARGWSTSNSFIWIPNLINPYYKVTVWVRSAGNNSDNYEKIATSGLYQIK
jgi:hypothetical protein